MNRRPIANKYREGKMKRTLKRELKVLEIAGRETFGASKFLSPRWEISWEGCSPSGSREVPHGVAFLGSLGRTGWFDQCTFLAWRVSINDDGVIKSWGLVEEWVCLHSQVSKPWRHMARL